MARNSMSAEIDVLLRAIRVPMLWNVDVHTILGGTKDDTPTSTTATHNVVEIQS